MPNRLGPISSNEVKVRLRIEHKQCSDMINNCSFSFLTHCAIKILQNITGKESLFSAFHTT